MRRQLLVDKKYPINHKRLTILQFFYLDSRFEMNRKRGKIRKREVDRNGDRRNKRKTRAGELSSTVKSWYIKLNVRDFLACLFERRTTICDGINETRIPDKLQD